MAIKILICSVDFVYLNLFLSPPFPLVAFSRFYVSYLSFFRWIIQGMNPFSFFGACHSEVLGNLGDVRVGAMKPGGTASSPRVLRSCDLWE